jgi:hypothetical protein
MRAARRGGGGGGGCSVSCFDFMLTISSASFAPIRTYKMRLGEIELVSYPPAQYVYKLSACGSGVEEAAFCF